MIRLNCFIKTTPENRDMVIADATLLTEFSLKEKGCIAYDIFASQTRPEVLMICETWADEAALDAHKNSEHYAKYGGNLHKLAEMKLERFDF